MKQRWWLLAVGCWLSPAIALAGSDSTATETVERHTPPPAKPYTLGPWWIGVWGGVAQHSEFATRLGPRHRDFYIAGIRLGRQLSESPRFAVDYFVDLVPLLRSTNNPVAYRETTCYAWDYQCRPELEMTTLTVHGYGLTPIGLQLRTFPRSRVQLVLGLNLGAAWYDKPVPDPGEKQLNFMGELAAGVQVRVGRTGALLAGIRQNHTSNANTGPANPGLDSRVLYVGATRSLGRRSQP